MANVIRIKADDENNGETFWSELRAKYPSIASRLYYYGITSIWVEEWQAIQVRKENEMNMSVAEFENDKVDFERPSFDDLADLRQEAQELAKFVSACATGSDVAQRALDLCHAAQEFADNVKEIMGNYGLELDNVKE